MTDPLDPLLVDVRANTQGFAQDMVALRRSFDATLVDGLAGNVQRLLDARAETSDAGRANTAIFYSISNCQEGLRSIPFGNYLIKRVVGLLQAELSQLQRFATALQINPLVDEQKPAKHDHRNTDGQH